MDYFRDLFTKKHMPELVLSVLLALYLVMGYQLPEGVATMIDSTVGKIVVVVVALMLFAYSNPVLGVPSVAFAYSVEFRYIYALIFNVSPPFVMLSSYITNETGG